MSESFYMHLWYQTELWLMESIKTFITKDINLLRTRCNVSQKLFTQELIQFSKTKKLTYLILKMWKLHLKTSDLTLFYCLIMEKIFSWSLVKTTQLKIWRKYLELVLYIKFSKWPNFHNWSQIFNTDKWSIWYDNSMSQTFCH